MGRTLLPLAALLLASAYVTSGQETQTMMVTTPSVDEVGDLDCPDDLPCTCRVAHNKHGNGTERVIDCSHRNLSSAPNFSELTGRKFDKILLNDNKITMLAKNAFRGLEVKVINLSNNQLRSIADLAFVDVIGVEELHLENCSLTSAPVPLEQMTTLKKLHLQMNRVQTLAKRAFEELRDLEYLDLSHNPVQFASPFDSFDNLVNLRTLKLQNCSLPTLPLDALEHTPDLESLVLTGNKIYAIPEGVLEKMPKLHELDMEGNPLAITSLEIFHGLKHLRTLKISGCNISHLNPDKMKPFHRLHNFAIKHCQLHGVAHGTFAHVKDLKRLDIGGNPRLDLSRRLFEDLHNTLQHVGLEEMNLTSFPAHHLRHLRALRKVVLTGNRISTLPAEAFAELHGTHGLDIHLERNHMTSIASEVTHGSPKPLRLFLQHNNLTTLTFMEADPCSFDAMELHLAANPLECDCETHSLVQKKIAGLAGHCQTPEIYRGVSLAPPIETYRKLAPGEGDFETVANIQCSAQLRGHMRYDCACRTWLNLNSSLVCAGASRLAATRTHDVILLMAVTLVLYISRPRD